MTGLILANCAVDKVIHDTYFVVAHFHLVLRMGAAFGVIVSLHLWLPLLTGLMFDGVASLTNFLIFFRRVNIIFLPMHAIGLLGMRRKVVDRPHRAAPLVILSSLGVELALVGVLRFVMLLIELFYRMNLVLSRGGKSAEIIQSVPLSHTCLTPPYVRV